MSQKLSTRQLRQHTVLPMVGNSVDEFGDSVLSKIDAQLAKHFEDRNILITDGGIVTFTGTQVQFTEALNIVLNQKISGAAPQIISLAATTRNISASGRMIYAVIDRTAGTATVTDDATTLPAAASANQEVFLIAKRVDATDGTQRLYFRNGAAFNAGQSARLGSAGSGSGGSGTGDDLNALTFKASFTDLFDDIPTATNSGVDTGAGKTDSTLYSAVNALFQLAYDASKTVTGTGTSMTLSGTPSFTVKIGDFLIVAGQARRITAIPTQTTPTIESAFTTNPSGAQATVSQGVYSKDINNFAGDGLAPSTAFSTSINQILMNYEDTSTSGDKIFDANVAPVIGFSASSDGTSYTDVQVRPTNLSDLIEMTSLPTSSTSLYLRFFANKTSGSGTVNILGYKVFFHRDSQAQDGTLLNQSYALTNGAGTQVNVSSLSVVSGKTRLKKSWSYPVAVNPGTVNGALKVYLNGQKLPRFISASATPDAWYKEIDQTTIELDQDYSAASLALEVVQDIAVIDSSDTNSTAINQSQETIGEGFQSIVKSSQLINATSSPGTPASGTFYSTINNRAALPDLTQDLKVRLGLERIPVQNIFQLQNEFGPSGEMVWGALNDTLGQIRFVGPGWANSIGASGIVPNTANVGDYVEVTFFGTGLNLLSYYDSNNSDYRASVDGGSEGSNFFITGKSSLTANRMYSVNAVSPAVAGLALGVHTVKIRLNSINLSVQGFEIVNEVSTLKVQPGSSYVNSKKLTLSSQQSPSYNSTFESGTLGSRGGRVIVYQKADGSIAKAVNPAGSQLNLTSADHSNEELVRTYSWQEFGAGRGGSTFSDDFNNLPASGANSAGFILEDGSTELMGTSIQRSAAAVSNFAVRINANSGYLTITFVGTGLDIMRIDEVTSGTANTWSVTVDGTNVGNLNTSGSTTLRKESIVSGLAYGTHMVKITQVSSTTFAMCIKQFLVYQPKKPTLPSGAIELADYNIMGNFTANSTPGMDFISSGVLRKSVTREMIFQNGTGGTQDWQLSFVAGVLGFWQANSDRQNAAVSYTFFGTGFDFRFDAGSNRSANISVTLNGLAATTANFATLTSAVYGTGVTFASGVLDQLDAAGQGGSGLIISNLPLGVYTVKFNNNSAGAFIIANALDIITPIHSSKSNLYGDLQNTLPVGSCGISDNRKTSMVKEILPAQKSWAQAIGVTSSPTTTSTSLIPMPDMSTTINVRSNQIKVSYSVDVSNGTSTASVSTQIYVDGVAYGTLRNGTSPTGGIGSKNVDSLVIPVAPGFHKVELYWAVDSGTGTALGTRRNLTVEER